MTQAIKVEYEELMARAAELEAPISGLPTENPQPPCRLPVAISAAEQLGLSADNMRTYLRVGERERLRLAESLRNAAKAFEETDEGAEQAINGSTSVSAAMPRRVDEDLDLATPGDTPMAATADPGEYVDLKQRFWDFEHGDQGVSFDRFADAWEAHQRALLQARDRFRPFAHWEGEASYAVESNFDSHRSWLYQMAENCGRMAKDARGVAAAQRWSQTGHVRYQYKYPDGQWHYADMLNLENAYNSYPSESYRWHCMQIYMDIQELSDAALAEYMERGALPLAPLNPAAAPVAYKIDPPTPPSDDETIDPGNPSAGLPLDNEDLSDEDLADPTGMPTLPTLPTSEDDSGLTDELTDASTWAPGGSTGSGLKPASFGGRAGVPSMPLQPWGYSDGTSRPAATPAGGPGPRIPAAYAALGSGGMGAPPMGGQGANGQNNRKGKRLQHGDQGDEAIYKEDRAWTAPVIGNRRRNDLPGGDVPVNEDAA